MSAEQYISAKEIAHRLAVEPDVVESWCVSGALEANKFPGVEDYRISERALGTFLRATRVLPRPDGQYSPTSEIVRTLAERMLRGVVPERPIEGAGEETLRVFIHCPSVQRIDAKCTNLNGTWLINIQFWPADTVAQAREFFRKVDIDAFLGLQTDRKGPVAWDIIRAHPHLSFVQAHFELEFDPVRLEKYLRYWKDRQEAIRQYGREEGGPNFTALYNLLEEIHPFTDPGDKAFQQNFLATERKTANFVPGLEMTLTLSYQEAQQLETEGSLIEQIRTSINSAMATWGESLP